MTDIYIEIITQWPLIIAVLFTFLALKSMISKKENSITTPESVAKLLQSAISNRKRDTATITWLKKARNVNKIIGGLKSDPPVETKTSRETTIVMSNYQKLIFGWVCAWIAIATFFIAEIFLDPAIWGRNWILLPYFFYYIGLGLILFLKK